MAGARTLAPCPQSPLTASAPLGLPVPAPAPVELQQAAAQAPKASAGDAAPAPKKFLGYEALTWAKIIPLGLMFFCILFNYTILRDTKVRERLSGAAQVRGPIASLGMQPTAARAPTHPAPPS